jgi:anthranilate phosphoribosyltransferase
MFDDLLQTLDEGRDLNAQQIAMAVEQLVAESVSTESKAEFLSALARKGETPDEIAAFARDLRARAVALPVDAATRSGGLLDVVGTGGDRLGTFNISTCAAIIAAAGGVTVTKHGNRAVTSKTGSADVIEELGLPVDITPEQAARFLKKNGFVFLFAPRYHPAFRHIGPARKLCASRGQPTLFNYLGPLLNPASPDSMLVGVPRPALCQPLAAVLQSLGVRRAMVVSGCVGAVSGGSPEYLDEFSILGETTMAAFKDSGPVTVSTFDPATLPIQKATLDDLRGGDRTDNARIVRQVLSGEDRSPKRDAVLINAAAAFQVAGKVGSMAEGWTLAAGIIDSGKASAKLHQLSQPL